MHPHNALPEIARKTASGALIGIFFLLPGVSGGAMAATLGLYDQTIVAISQLLRNFKKSVDFLWPIVLGILVGIFVASTVLSGFMKTAQTQVVSLLIGMIAGSLPGLSKRAVPKKLDLTSFLCMASGILFTLAVFLLEGGLVEGYTAAMNVPIALFAGAILAVGTVIPGISGPTILLYLGFYTPMITAVSTFQWSLLLPGVLGFACALVCLVKAAAWVFRTFPQPALCVVLGFVAGSLLLIFPQDFFIDMVMLNVLLVCLGFVFGLYLGRLGNRSLQKEGGV